MADNFFQNTQDFLTLSRLTALLKARYPEWDKSVWHAQKLIERQKQAYPQAESVFDKHYNPLLDYEPALKNFRDGVQKLTPAEQNEFAFYQQELKDYSGVFFKDDMEEQLIRFITFPEKAFFEADLNFLKDEEKKWAEVYGQMFGKEALTDVYKLYNRPAPLVRITQPAPLEKLSPQMQYERAKFLARKTEEEKILLQAFDFNWNEKNPEQGDFNASEKEILNLYLRHSREETALYNQMDNFQRFTFSVEKEAIAEDYNKKFQTKLESAMTGLYEEYKETGEPVIVWDLSLFNKYAAIYKNRYGEEALMKIPAVQKIKEEFDFRKTKTDSPAQPVKTQNSAGQTHVKTSFPDGLKTALRSRQERALNSILTEKSESYTQQDGRPPVQTEKTLL